LPPSVLMENVKDYFNPPVPSPYMLLVAEVKKKRRKTVPTNFHEMDFWDKLYYERSDVQARYCQMLWIEFRTLRLLPMPLPVILRR
jgi:predicted NodU family carbamoyl transferase